MRTITTSVVLLGAATFLVLAQTDWRVVKTLNIGGEGG
jgi:hypothetical protein